MSEVIGIAKSLAEVHLGDGDSVGAGARRLFDLLEEHYPVIPAADLDKYLETDAIILEKRARAKTAPKTKRMRRTRAS